MTLDFSRPGKSTDNPFIESFNCNFRGEFLNVHWFLSLTDVQEKLKCGVEITSNTGCIVRESIFRRASIDSHTKKPKISNNRCSVNWKGVIGVFVLSRFYIDSRIDKSTALIFLVNVPKEI